jgi:hypothetical protein
MREKDRSMRIPTIATLSLMLCQPLAGQVIQGRTVDAESRAWVPATLVTLLTEAGDSVTAIVSDGAGLFSVTVPAPGRYMLRAERLGYSDVVTAVIPVAAGEQVTVEVLLGADPVALDPLVVTSRRGSERGAMGAHRRRADWIQRTGIGKVITREELDRQPRPYVSDYLYTVSGMRVVGSGLDARVVMRGCSPQIFVDGVRSPGLGINAVSPDAIEGIEIYRSLSEIPPELRGVGNCGAIALFTRTGEPTHGKWTLLQKIMAGTGGAVLGVLLITQF